MDNRNQPEMREHLMLTLVLPSGRECRAVVYPSTFGGQLIGELVARGLVEQGRYEFVSENGMRADADDPLGLLFDPDADRATAELHPLRYEGPDIESGSYMQDLYGCPPAVMPQADQLADCTVTRNDL